MSDRIDTRDGSWREVPADTPAEAGRDRLVFDGVDRTRIWVREEPVPPLPTAEGTTIRVTASTDPDLVGALLHLDLSDADYPWHGNSDAYPARNITGFEVLAEPRAIRANELLADALEAHGDQVRRETAKAAIERYRDIRPQHASGDGAAAQVEREFEVEES